MADNPLPPNDTEGNLPSGTRGVRKGAHGKGSARQTLLLKKRKVSDEMSSDEGAGVIPVKEKLSPATTPKHPKSEGKAVDENWGNAPSGQQGARVVLWALALIVPVLAIVTAFVLINQDPPETPSEGQLNFNFNLSKEDEFDFTGPRAWFEENPHVHYVGAIDILDRLNQVEGGKIPELVFRHRDFALGEITDHGLGWDSDFMTADPRTFKWTIGDTNNIGFLILEGLRKDQSTFRSYFVNSEQGLRMDWAASTAWGEVPPADLFSAVGQREVMIRCSLDKQPHYDSKVDEQRSWFLVMLPGSEKQVWGFAPSGSPVDRDLLALFNFGSFILDRQEDVRAVIRVGNGKGNLKENQVEIVELLAGDWVLP